MDDEGFSELMDRARETARAGGRRGGGEGHDKVIEFARSAGFQSRFVGYEATEAETRIGALERENGRFLAKLDESPFYAEGGGQVSDSGVVETPSGRARVEDVYRVGDDQAVALAVTEGELAVGEPATAIVDRETRLATMANHTATHLLHAALRAELGTHVRQAGSYVGPDKLRFDFTHGERLTADQQAAVEEAVNAWIVQSHAVRAVQTTKDEAQRLGAMALFGEKYGDIVRMVEIEGVSRELCGGTHVATTAEIGLFHLTTETSSASNVRRVEAVTGPEGIELFRKRTRELQDIAAMLRVPASRRACTAVEKLQAQLRDAAKRPREDDRALADSLVAGATELGGIRIVAEVVDAPDAKALLELSDRVKQSLGDAAVVLGTAVDGRVHLVANFAQAAVERGTQGGRSGERGGQGDRRWGRRPRHDGAGRRPRPGQAAGGDRRGPAGDGGRARMSRILALDFGDARCGCAVSDPTGTLATPLESVSQPGTRRGLNTIAELAREREVERVVVGLPLTLAGEEGAQARATREFASRLAELLDVPVELHDERLTTRQAERIGGGADADSRAAAHLLVSYLAAAGRAS